MGVRISDILSPLSPSDTYPVIDVDVNAKGFARAVADEAERNAIHANFRSTKLFVLRLDTGQIEHWNGSGWDVVPIGAAAISEWGIGESYLQGQIVYHLKSLYRCNTVHTASSSFITDRDDGKWTNLSGTYTHQQASPSSIWTVAHNLGRYPAVTIMDDDSYEIVAAVEHVDINTVKIYMNKAQTGTAECS